jgi:hypothetical protein
LIILWLSRTTLINEIIIYNTYSEQLTYERSLELFGAMKKIEWIIYIFMPLVLLIKFGILSMVLYTGIFIIGIETKIRLSSVFNVVMASEFIFIIAGFLKFMWFYLFAGNYTLVDLGFFYPLSLINLFKPDEVNKLWILPLQTINIFQILYIIMLAYGLHKICNINKSNAEIIPMITYIPSLVIWIAFVLFISIDNSF